MCLLVQAEVASAGGKKEKECMFQTVGVTIQPCF